MDNKYTLETIEPNTAWATRFWIETMLDSTGAPIDTRNLQPGATVEGTPGRYESLGVIALRDKTNRKLKVVDTRTHREFTVDWDQTWDLDRVEWRDDSVDT